MAGVRRRGARVTRPHNRLTPGRIAWRWRRDPECDADHRRPLIGFTAGLVAGWHGIPEAAAWAHYSAGNADLDGSRVHERWLRGYRAGCNRPIDDCAAPR